MDFIKQYFEESKRIIDSLDTQAVSSVVETLYALKQRQGRMFILGVGGGAAHASHAVNDFRKLAGIEAYAPTDNVSELTARTNDEGWDTVFVEWLKTSRLSANDLLFVISVGGGSREANVSPNLVRALQYARQLGTSITGIVGRDGGYTARVADACVIIPTVNASHVTPHTESFQALVWHMFVSHPKLKSMPTKWESVQGPSVKIHRRAA